MKILIPRFIDWINSSCQRTVENIRIASNLATDFIERPEHLTDIKGENPKGAQISPITYSRKNQSKS